MIRIILRYRHNSLDLLPVPRSDRAVTRTRGNRRMGGLRNCRRGSVAVEFALASVPLMLMVFGFIATAAVFNTWSTMQSNTQYAARLMSTGQITSNNTGTITTSNNSVTTACSSSMRNTQVEYYA